MAEKSSVSLDGRAQSGRMLLLDFIWFPLTVIILIGAFWPFLQIEKASLWLDEFWSIFFSDPSQNLFDLYRTRIVQELHPPLYFILNHLWMLFYDGSIYAPRVLSAIIGLALLAVAAYMSRHILEMNTRLFLLAFIVTGYPFVHFTTEARNYMLAFLIGTAQVFIFHGLATNVQRRENTKKITLTLFALISLLNGLNHYYGFIYSGALFAVLCLLALAKTRYLDFVAFVVAGCGVFIVNGIYATWALSHTRFSIHDNWIPGDLTYQTWTIREYLWLAIGGNHAGLLVIFSAAVLLAYCLFQRWSAEWSSFTRTFLPHVLAIIIFILLAISISRLWAPSITTRNLLISIPSIWICFALAIDAMLKSRIFTVKKYTTLLLLVVPAWGLPFALASGGKNKEEWRASAAFVNSIEACHGKEIPVYAGPRPVEHAFFFGFYLRPEHQMHPVLKNEPRANFDPQCPIRLWTVRFLDEPPVKNVIRDLGEKAEIVEFRNKRMWTCWFRSCALTDPFGERMAIIILEKID
jgi:hypothetical protein